MADQLKIIAGSGNVFADLGFANAENMRLRADAVEQIRKIVAEKNLKQAKVAKLLEPQATGCLGRAQWQAHQICVGAALALPHHSRPRHRRHRQATVWQVTGADDV
jgi:hypothetical protein